MGVLGMLPFLNKSDSQIPDTFGIKIFYLDGKSEDYEIANRWVANGMFEFVTQDDIWHFIPMSAIKRVEYDKNFSKMVALKEKAKKEAEEAKE